MAAPSGFIDSVTVLIDGRHILSVEVKSPGDQLRELWVRITQDSGLSPEISEEFAPFPDPCDILYSRFNPPLPREGWREAMREPNRQVIAWFDLEIDYRKDYYDPQHQWPRHKRTAEDILFAFDFPPSLVDGPFQGQDGRSSFESREFLLFCHERNLARRPGSDRRFICTASQLHAVTPIGTQARLLVKYGRRNEVNVYKELATLRSSSRLLADPTHISELMFSVTPLLLPRDRFFFALPDYGLSLFDYWEDDYDEYHSEYSTLWECAHHLVSAVEFLHTHGIVHRDIKPHNVTIEPKAVAENVSVPSYSVASKYRPHLKLIDFSAAVTGLTPGVSQCRGVCGTYGYIPPEVTKFIPPGTQPRLRTPLSEEGMSWIQPYVYPTEEEKEAARAAFNESAVPSYCPFSVDVWCTGNVISLLGGMSQDPQHRDYLKELGIRIKDDRPSSLMVDGERSELFESIGPLEKDLCKVDWVVRLRDPGIDWPYL